MKQIQTGKITLIITALVLSLVFSAGLFAATVQRTNLAVGNLSCTSCLANIETELKNIQGVIGMDGDLRRGRVMVDHDPSVKFDRLETAISNLGYPAKMEWTATVGEQNSNRFAQGTRYGSGCSSSGCGGSGSSGASPTAWKKAPATGLLSRTTLQVGNLSCSSCLANIAAELQKSPETYGMNGYLSRGIVIVDHAPGYDSARIAGAISVLGYPARVMSTNDIPAQKAFSTTGPKGTDTQVRPGSGCNSRGPCNATSAAWQKLYNRYFTKTNSK